MWSRFVMLVPDELELFEFFESEPIEFSPEDGLYVYGYTDHKGVQLIFSFNDVEGSVQARLLIEGSDAALFSQEGASQLTIENDASGQYLRCRFDLGGASADAQIRVHPEVYVKWATLLR